LPASYWFIAWLIFKTWRWRQYVPPKCRMAFNGLRTLWNITEAKTLREIVLFVTENERHR
jgi:hypothetical protein